MKKSLDTNRKAFYETFIKEKITKLTADFELTNNLALSPDVDFFDELLKLRNSEKAVSLSFPLVNLEHLTIEFRTRIIKSYETHFSDLKKKQSKVAEKLIAKNTNDKATEDLLKRLHDDPAVARETLGLFVDSRVDIRVSNALASHGISKDKPKPAKAATPPKVEAKNEKPLGPQKGRGSQQNCPARGQAPVRGSPSLRGKPQIQKEKEKNEKPPQRGGLANRSRGRGRGGRGAAKK